MTRSSPSESFPKTARLLRRPEFLRVQRRGKRVVLQDVIVAFRRSPAIASRSRVGFTVSKKVGNAVVRNRVRRRLRDVVRKELHLHRNAACRDIVFIARASASTASYSRLADQVVRGLRVAHGLTNGVSATKSGVVGN